MWPFDEKGNSPQRDFEKELDAIANGGWKRKKGTPQTTVQASPGKAAGGSPPAHKQQQGEQKSSQAAKTVAKQPAAPPQPPAATPAVEAGKGWSVTAHINKKGVQGKIIKVGPFSAWLADGDTAKRKKILDAINHVFRAACIEEVVAQF